MNWRWPLQHQWRACFGSTSSQPWGPTSRGVTCGLPDGCLHCFCCQTRQRREHASSPGRLTIAEQLPDANGQVLPREADGVKGDLAAPHAGDGDPVPLALEEVVGGGKTLRPAVHRSAGLEEWCYAARQSSHLKGGPDCFQSGTLCQSDVTLAWPRPSGHHLTQWALKPPQTSNDVSIVQGDKVP